MVFERLAERVQRAGADVSVDDAEGADRECPHPRCMTVTRAAVTAAAVVIVAALDIGMQGIALDRVGRTRGGKRGRTVDRFRGRSNDVGRADWRVVTRCV